MNILFFRTGSNDMQKCYTDGIINSEQWYTVDIKFSKTFKTETTKDLKTGYKNACIINFPRF